MHAVLPWTLHVQRVYLMLVCLLLLLALLLALSSVPVGVCFCVTR